MDHGDGHNMAAVTAVTNETHASYTIGQGNTGDHREDGETGDTKGLGRRIVLEYWNAKHLLNEYLQSCWLDLLTNASE